MEGNLKRRLSEVNARAVSRGQNELVCKFKMAVGDKVILGGRLWTPSLSCAHIHSLSSD